MQERPPDRCGLRSFKGYILIVFVKFEYYFYELSARYAAPVHGAGLRSRAYISKLETFGDTHSFGGARYFGKRFSV